MTSFNPTSSAPISSEPTGATTLPSGMATGAATVQGVGMATVTATGSTSGLATVTGIQFVPASVGSANGSATVSGVGIALVTATGSASGSASVIGVSNNVPYLLFGEAIKQCTSKIAGQPCWGYFPISATNGATYVTSVWLWISAGQSSITQVSIGAEGNATGLAARYADITKTNQWQRIWCVYTLTATITNVVVRVSSSVIGIVGYMTCAQNELAQPQSSAALPTSYISTTTSSPVTRAADYNHSARQIFLDPAYSSLQPLLIGIQQPWNLSENTLDIPLRDPSYYLDNPIQTSQYQGTGSYQGTASLAGTQIPMCRGGSSTNPIKNVSPVLIDPSNLIYQYTDAAGTVVTLYESAAANRTYAGDTTNLYAGSTASGQYRTDNSRGLFQLGNAATGAITVDCTGSFAIAGAQTTAIDIAYYLLTEEALVPAANIDQTNFLAADAAYNYPAGIYISPNDNMTGTDAVSQMLIGLGAKLIPGRDGKLRIFMLRAPSGTPVATYDTNIAVDVVPSSLPSDVSPPPYRMRISYQQNYTVQSTYLPSSTAAQQQFVQQQYRYASASSSAVLSGYLKPNDCPPINGCLLRQTDAQAVANDLIALWGTRRRLYAVTLPVSVAIQREIKDVVEIVWPLDNLAGGQIGIIIGDSFKSEDATVDLLVLV